MPRIPRIVLENIPYHITQRGNARQQIFFDPYDYHLYLDLRAYGRHVPHHRFAEIEYREALQLTQG